jgi:hypothetical protein
MSGQKDVAGIVPKLRRGQIIEVIWIDACESRNVATLEDVDFATYKVTLGRFLACKRERTHNQPYIIIYEEVTDRKYFEIMSIPLADVMDIRIIGDEK